VVPYKITWFRRGWVGLGQLIWVIVVPIPGHLGVYSWFGGHCGGIIKKVIIREGSSLDRDQQGTRDGRTKLSTAGLGSFTDSFTDIDWALQTPAWYLQVYRTSRTQNAVVSCVGYLLCGFRSYSFCWAPHWEHADPPIALTIVHCDGTPTLALYTILRQF